MAGVAAIGTLVAGAQSIKVNWREKAPFNDYRTFALAPDQKEGFVTQFVPKYVTSALRAKNLDQAKGSQPPDLKVVYHFKTQDVVDATTTSDGYGWGGGPWGGWGGYGGWGGWGGPYGGGIATTRQQPRTIGVLTIDLVDSRSNEVVWRGQATEDSVANFQKGDEVQVWKSIGKMFEHYPPKPSKENRDARGK